MNMIASRTALPTPSTLALVALLCLAAFLATGSAAVAAGVNVHPGKWEMSTTVDQGRGTGTEKAPVTSRCIKPEDVKDSEAMTQAQQKDKRCTTIILSATSDRVAWSYECPTGSGSVDFTYGGDSYEQSFKFLIHTKTGDHTTVQHVKAHRVGDC
jgi:Protein of unknown function (DUF3617)